MKTIEVSELRDYLIEKKANAVKISNLEKFAKRTHNFKNIILVSNAIAAFGSFDNFIFNMIESFETKPKELILTLYAENGSAYIKKGIVAIKITNEKKSISANDKDIEKLIQENKELKNELYQRKQADMAMLEMQKSFTVLANNYSGFIGRMSKLIDKCEPIIDLTLNQIKENGGLGS